MSSFKLEGKLTLVEDVQQVSEKFSKREFVIEIENERNPQYNDFVKFQLSNANTAKVDGMGVGDTIEVKFDINGRKWEKEGKVNYFTTLNAWDVVAKTKGSQPAQAPASAPAPAPAAKPEESDLPF